MGEHSTDVHLLSTGDILHDYEKKTSFFKSTSKWVLKLLMWAVFIGWIAFLFLYPLEFVRELFNNKWSQATQRTPFGITGSVLLAFSGPVLIIAFLSVVYLIISGYDDVQEKKTGKHPSFRLSKFPVLVDGPFGVVSAAEFIGILLFAVFVIWSCSVYAVQSWDVISQSQLSSFYKSCLMLEKMGLRLGLIGLFCLALLFLPISRGSVILRVIDIPFEHATRYHVWLGHLTMALLTLHGLLHIIAWAMEGRLLQEVLEWEDIGVANLAGVISLAAGILMWVTSLQTVRRLNFEVFFYTHQLYVVFVIFLALHVGDFIFGMAAGGIFLFIVDRFLRFIQSRKTVDIISATSLPCGTLKLVLSKPANLRYNALSFIFLQVRELSWLQWHPFSVSSSPLDGKHHLSVIIKGLGEWTHKLKAKISSNNNSEEPQKLLESQLQSLITASVEGPYGHESPYHLSYKYLVLVAGGIGISPFLAVVSDILHRVKEGKPCVPRNILIVWAIKKSDDLPLLSMLDMEFMDPMFLDALNLEIQIYVTRELEPNMEEGKALKLKAMNSGNYPLSKRSGISILVGTGDNIWSGIYIIASTIGFIIFLGLLDVYYINAYNIESWRYKGLLLVVCMVTSVVIVGGLVVALWHLWERKIQASDELDYESENINTVTNNGDVEHKTSSAEYLVNSSIIRYGHRPDFKDIFESITDHWGAVDVGVIVCGPSTLQSSVAAKIRSHTLTRSHNHPVFHFNNHSFDL